MTKIKLQAQFLKPGDIVGTGEKVISTYIGVRTPSGKIEVRLQKQKKDGRLIDRTGMWGKYTMIGVQRETN